MLLTSPLSSTRGSLALQLEETRRRTLALAQMVADEDRCRLIHPGYSPFDWHLGHIAMQEAYWVLQQAACQPSFDPELDLVFANIPACPKDRRTDLPPRAVTLCYLQAVRQRTLDFLERAPLDSPGRLLRHGHCFRFALAHEWQHQETMIELLYLIGKPPRERASGLLEPLPPPPIAPGAAEVKVPAGTFRMGSDDPTTYDNEQPSHEACVQSVLLDRTPVTVAQYREFVADDGYRRRELWRQEGWAWLQNNRVNGPHHLDRGPFGPRQTHSGEPVMGVSWFEADAYARWCGRRLPTEPEWEHAAARDLHSGESRLYPWGEEQPDCRSAGKWRADAGARYEGPQPVGSFPTGASACGALDMAGGVWEWTSSPFEPYPDFQAFPYDGYSKDHFDGRHRVLKGGSWATQGPLLRCTFRNFYTPDYRQGFVGFRCARDA